MSTSIAGLMARLKTLTPCVLLYADNCGALPAAVCEYLEVDGKISQELLCGGGQTSPELAVLTLEPR